MGGGNIKTINLNRSELDEYHNITSLSHDDILSIFNKYVKLSALKSDDGLIDYEEFCLMVGKQNFLSKKIFRVIDQNNDKKINFREFIVFISCFVSGSYDEQKQVSFKILADVNTHLICKSFMFNLIKETFQHDKILSNYFDNNLINELILNAFKTEDNEFLTYEKYEDIIDKCPGILDWFKVDIQKFKDKNILSKRSSCLI